MIPKGHVTITGSTHTSYMDPETKSGKPMERSMCSRCGSPIRIIEAMDPDTWCMQYGLFAGESDLPPPKLEMWRRRACDWAPKVGEKVLDEQ